MRILIAIESCGANRKLHKAQRETWIKDLPADVSYRFFMGGPTLISCLGDWPWLMRDEIWLPVDDSYQGLSLKTRAICQWAVDGGFDYLFKADTDTLVSARNLFNSMEYYDYVGGYNADIMPSALAKQFPDSTIEFASGGAGYWLSRRAFSLVASSAPCISAAEDVFVAATLKPLGITPRCFTGYKWKPGEQIDDYTATFHLSSALQKKYTPELMYEYYEKMQRIQL
jgi:hypothetical protein